MLPSLTTHLLPLFAILLTPLTAFQSQSPLQHPGHPHKKTLYFLDNDPAGASIVAVPLHGKTAVRTSTGGLGAPGLTVAGGPGPAGPDSLYSQGAVVVVGNYLFTVNAGSNTLAMFFIDPRDPLHPQLVGKPVDTMGAWPNSVAYSEVLRTACVLNSGLQGSVACFNVDHDHGLTALDTSPRPIFPALNQTNPASGPKNSGSQLVFSPSSDRLVAAVKGNARGMPAIHGAMNVWAVVNGKVSDSAVVTSPSDMYMQFGFTFTESNDRLLVADSSYGGSLLDIGSDLNVVETNHFNLTELNTTCWAVYSKELGNGYLIDAGRPQIAVIDISSGTLSGVIALNASLIGLFDTVVSGKKLYVSTGVAEIAVIHLDEKNLGHLVDQVDLSSLGNRKYWQGLAMYSAEEDRHHG